MKRIVFLDFDGVVNRRLWTYEDGRWALRFGYPGDGAVNDRQAVQWVSEFCERYGYDIVITSTWRKEEGCEACLRAAGLRESVKILGVTSLPPRDRAEEISDYLSEHTDVESYLVFDDDASLLSKKAGSAEEGELPFPSEGDHYKNLVLCRKDRGFGEEEYNRAVATHFCLRYGGGKIDARVAVGGRDDKNLHKGAVELLYATGALSTALLQRRLCVGYGRAVSILDFLRDHGVILRDGPNERIRYKPLVDREEAMAILEAAFGS